MELLVVNQVGAVRKETLYGKPFLAVPLCLIVPGVLPGSAGPLLYPEDEIEESVDRWNNMPMVLYHPMTVDNLPLSGRHPDILNQFGLGFVFNCEADPRLIGEGWFDLDMVREVSPAVYLALKRNQRIELSTGLRTKNIPVEKGATYNGIPFDAVATEYEPDHLAILPDQVGACSLEDGCGVLVNQRQSRRAVNRKLYQY